MGVNHSMEPIANLLKTMKFRKKILGGVNEADVWKKIGLLQEEYEKSFEMQREKYEAIIDFLKEQAGIREK